MPPKSPLFSAHSAFSANSALNLSSSYRSRQMQRPSKRIIASALLFAVTALPVVAQQPMNMPQGQSEHHHMNIPVVQPFYPHLGRAQENPKSPLFTLEEAQRLAAESNPTLRQADAEIRASKARQQQSGLYPNPTVGYTGDEIRGGSVGGGKQGFFVQQTIVTAGKLARSRDVFSKETQLAEIEAQEQKIRVETSVKTAFLRVLAAQELLDVRRDLAKIQQDFTDTQRQLSNTGQADESEVLDAEVDAQRLRLSARMQENTLREEWRSLTALLGRPDLPLSTVSGDLEHNWPDLNEDQAVESIATQSPANRIAEASAGRASAELVRAKLEKQRVALTLRDRAATAADQYANAKLMALEYREQMLPRAKRAYTLMVEKYGLMLAANPRVLQSQRKLFDLQAEYILALENVWTAAIALQGFLLTDGLESPARPGEVDRPVRETNLPLPDRMMSPSDSMPRP